MSRDVSRVVRLSIGAAVVAGAFALPGLASAACTIPGSPDAGFDPPQDFTGNVTDAQQGSFIQIPFNVPAGTTGIRVRYCFDNTNGTVLDMGVYEPLHAGDTVPGMPERRGWSGSAVRDLAIAVNGFSPPATYEANRKAYVHGYTTRAYQPGALPPGQWTAELGAAFVGVPTADFAVRVETSSSSDWSNQPYSPAAMSTTPANANPGWYAGDVHVHGEQEPGNAQVTTSLDYGFKALSQGGAGLDWIGLVDHNNDISEGEIGRYQGNYPGKLVIPGTEVTTYHGHYNSIGSTGFADFRTGPILSYPSMAQIGPGVTPASQFAQLQGQGGWTQINHPSIFKSAPAACRGCFWDYNDAQTGYPNVDAVEVQTGPAEIGGNLNPFTLDAIAFYEASLAAGNHTAAVASSDSHRADFTDVTTSPIGRGTTVVYADELSRPAIVAGIKADHTYAKPFGNDGPDIQVTARSPGASDAIIGDTITGPSLTLDVEVLRAGPTATRPGTYQVQLLKDGAPADAATVTSDDFTHAFSPSGPGRYSIEVTRAASDGVNRIEVYSSPVWFEIGENLTIGKLKLDKKHGEGKLEVTVAGIGKVTLSGKGLKTTKKTTKGDGKVKLAVDPKGKLADQLEEKGSAKVKAEVKFTPDDGLAVKDTKKLKLKQS